MRIIPNQDDMEERKEIWQWIKECIHECDLTPEKLSKTVGLSAGYIKRGIEGEPLGIRNAVFKFVKAFGLVDYRFEDENSEQEYSEFLKFIRHRKHCQRRLVDWGCE